jgi:hypothetical protein
MYCKKCGSLVGESNNFCRRCGAPAAIFALSGMPNVSFQTRILLKGVTIGASIAIIIICSLLAYSAYTNYPEKYTELIAYGFSANAAHYALIGLSSTIALSVPFVIYATFILIYSILDYFSPTARTIMNSKNLVVRAGNGLVFGGIIFASLSLTNYISDYYSPYSTGAFLFLLSAITGTMLLAIGVLLHVGHYFRLRKQGQKFKE